MNRLIKVALPIAASFVCWTASAGMRTDYFLTLDRTNRYASGAMGSVRNDTVNSAGMIGCSMLAGYINPGDLWLQCQAADANGPAVTCQTNLTSVISTSPLVKVAQSITSNSYLYFQWDANMTCTNLQVATGSMFQPIVF